MSALQRNCYQFAALHHKIKKTFSKNSSQEGFNSNKKIEKSPFYGKKETFIVVYSRRKLPR